MLFKDKLRQLRKNNKLTQDELADVLGVSRASLAKYETGANTPPTDVAVKIAQYFGCGLDYLFETDACGKTPDTLNKRIRILQRAADKNALSDKELLDILNYAKYRYPGRFKNLND